MPSFRCGFWDTELPFSGTANTPSILLGHLTSYTPLFFTFDYPQELKAFILWTLAGIPNRSCVGDLPLMLPSIHPSSLPVPWVGSSRMRSHVTESNVLCLFVFTLSSFQRQCCWALCVSLLWSISIHTVVLPTMPWPSYASRDEDVWGGCLPKIIAWLKNWLLSSC